MSRRSKNVFRLGLTSFFTDMSSEMIFPILPLFLTSVLGAPMSVVGLIEGIAEATSAVLKQFSGWISDKLGKKKPLVIAGYSLSTLTKPLLALATNWGHVLGVRMADRVGKGIRDSPRDALLAASVTKKKRGRGFGLHRALDTGGAVAGTLIASFVLMRYLGDAFKIIFLLSLVPGIIAVMILFFGVKERRDHIKKHIKVGFRHANPMLRRFFIIIGLFNLANFSYAFFILRAEDVGVVLSLIPIIYLVYNLVYAALAYPAGRLSDIIGRKALLTSGIFLFSLTVLGFGFFANSLSVWILFGLYGVFMAITDGIGRAFVSDLATRERRGTALGTYHMIIGITVFPANFFGGLLWDNISVQAPFIYAAVLSAVSAVLLLIFVRKK
ncbi:MFS transporter [Candidatus Woesearchaeota archaeon]|nr:MFS transporter [Candidatus Woesearchaeota archaeon]